MGQVHLYVLGLLATSLHVKVRPVLTPHGLVLPLVQSLMSAQRRLLAGALALTLQMQLSYLVQ